MKKSIICVLILIFLFSSASYANEKKDTVKREDFPENSILTIADNYGTEELVNRMEKGKYPYKVSSDGVDIKDKNKITDLYNLLSKIQIEKETEYEKEYNGCWDNGIDFQIEFYYDDLWVIFSFLEDNIYMCTGGKEPKYYTIKEEELQKIIDYIKNEVKNRDSILKELENINNMRTTGNVVLRAYYYTADKHDEDEIIVTSYIVTKDGMVYKNTTSHNQNYCSEIKTGQLNKEELELLKSGYQKKFVTDNNVDGNRWNIIWYDTSITNPKDFDLENTTPFYGYADSDEYINEITSLLNDTKVK